jgi:hypothetical protein
VLDELSYYGRVCFLVALKSIVDLIQHFVNVVFEVMLQSCCSESVEVMFHTKE